jgi:hypothetical protein
MTVHQNAVAHKTYLTLFATNLESFSKEGILLAASVIANGKEWASVLRFSTPN